MEGEFPRDKQPWDKSGFIGGVGGDGWGWVTWKRDVSWYQYYLISENRQYHESPLLSNLIVKFWPPLPHSHLFLCEEGKYWWKQFFPIFLIAITGGKNVHGYFNSAFPGLPDALKKNCHGQNFTVRLLFFAVFQSYYSRNFLFWGILTRIWNLMATFSFFFSRPFPPALPTRIGCLSFLKSSKEFHEVSWNYIY